MSLDDLQFALNNFNQGVQQVAVNNAISTAAQQSQQIQQSQMDGMQKQGALQNLGNMLALHLSGTNMPSDKIAQAFQAVSGPQAKTADDMYVQSQKSGDDSLMQAGQAKQTFDAQPGIAQAKMEQANKLEQIGASGQNELQKQMLDNRGKVDVEAMKLKLQQQLQDKKEAQQATKQFVAFQQDLDPARSRSGELGKIQTRLDAAGRLQGLFQQVDTQKDGASQNQYEELATGVATMLSNGTGGVASERIANLMPKTIQGDTQKMKAWLLNSPEGLKNQAFIGQLKDTVGRETTISSQQKRALQYGKLAAYEHLRDKDPVTFDKILSQQGLDMDSYQSFLKTGQPPSGSGSSSSTAVATKSFMNKKTGQVEVWQLDQSGQPTTRVK